MKQYVKLFLPERLYNQLISIAAKSSGGIPARRDAFIHAIGNKRGIDI